MQVLESNTEAQPPEGGIFLSGDEKISLLELLGTFADQIYMSRVAQKTLTEIFPPDKPELLFEEGELTLRYVHAVSQKNNLRTEAVINLLVEDVQEKQRIKHVLKADTREVFQEERRQILEWLESIDQDLILRSAGVVVEYEPPNHLLEFGVAYRQRIRELAGKESDLNRTVRQTAEKYIGRLVHELPDMATTLGRNYYEVDLYPIDKTHYLTRYDYQTEETVHFIDAGLEDYTNQRHAGTADYLMFLEDCVAE